MSSRHKISIGLVVNCDSPSPPIVDIVCFDPLHIALNLTILKRVG